MEVKLERIRFTPFRDMGGGEIVFDFGNDRHHAVRIGRGKPAAQVALMLRDLGEEMLRDEQIRDT